MGIQKGGNKARYSFKKEYHAEYQALINAIHRCHNPEHRSYHNYGARGIEVCKAWLEEMGFYKFLEHVGPRPSEDHSLDRINNDKGYEPRNVRWTDRTTQQNNRRKSVPCSDLGWGFGWTAKGEGRGRGSKRSPLIPYKDGLWTLIEACRDAGLNNFTVRQRLARGMTPQEALSLPVGETGEKRRNPLFLANLMSASEGATQ